jgi:5'-nucleotidase/UDP-sugar diphosphatase
MIVRMKSHNAFMTTILLSLFAAVLSACSSGTAPFPKVEPTPPKSFTEIVIFSVNDVHGRIYNFPKLKTLLDQEREKSDKVFFVSAGDLFSGNPIVDFHPEKGFPLIDLLSKTGLDVNVIGNHEFDYGQEALSARINQASFEFVCYNVDGGSGALAQVPEYTVIEKGGVKIAFVGVVETSTPGGYPLTHPRKIEGLTFVDGNAGFSKFSNLKNETGADLLVALTHQGEVSDEALLRANPFIDLVIGGHTNKEYGIAVGEDFMVMSGAHLETLGKTTIKLYEDGTTDYSWQLINLDNLNISENAELADLVNTYNNKPEFYEVIGSSAINHSRDETACFYTDALRQVSGSDFIIQNRGGVRANLDQGEVTPFDIYTIDPFGNGFETYNFTVAEMENVLESIPTSYSYSTHYNLIFQGEQIEIADVQGNLLDDNTSVTLSINDYLTNVFSSLFAEPNYIYDLTTADYLIEFFRSHATGPVDYSGCTN